MVNRRLDRFEKQDCTSLLGDDIFPIEREGQIVEVFIQNTFVIYGEFRVVVIEWGHRVTMSLNHKVKFLDWISKIEMKLSFIDTRTNVEYILLKLCDDVIFLHLLHLLSFRCIEKHDFCTEFKLLDVNLRWGRHTTTTQRHHDILCLSKS